VNITVPIYAQEQTPTSAGKSARPVALRPLFIDGLVELDESIQRGTARLARELRRELTRLARTARHEELAAYSFYPPLEDRILQLTLALGNRRIQVRHLFITTSTFGRRFVSTPSLPGLWFELARGETLEERAHEVLVEHYKLIERRLGADHVRPEAASITGKAWITSIEVSVDVPSVYVAPEPNIFAFIGASETSDGAAELEKVGRSLNSLYPDELAQATNREAEVTELTRLLSGSDNQPIVLSGKRLVGKSAIIHEFVRRRMDRRRSSEVTMHVDPRRGIADLTGDVWLISPQRLISGMSYVGQWETRLLAILKETKRKRHTLYFDDLVGLFSAGRTRSSSLNVADVLKPYIERREVRIVGETTPEALRVLQELDRSFVDLFKVLPVREPTEHENLLTLLGYRRVLEQQRNCHFQPEVLPTVIDLTRRYMSDAAFPGKAAMLLQTLATKHKESDVARENVLSEFSDRSGLNVRFLDDRVELNHKDVIDVLSREVVGQPAAVAACADAVTIAKARLNDPVRPIASFLFLGPTGVGKTQCAKSLAKYLFGVDRLLRFDMNECASYSSVARLIGTFDAPEGLLTSAVRREPFAILLFDEIEKAHPAFFDLLLGVMGDGRLTDARGQTVDFTNTIIILTSNLGAQEAATDLGFRQTNHSDASVYRQAAEKFFKPEFFNRLTRVVPFERLRREDVREIARHLIEDVFKREGLVRRGVKLVIDTEALNLLADAGYHPQLGARALKRTLEREVTAPIAARLCVTTPDQPVIIFLRAGERNIRVNVSEMTVVDAGAAPLMSLPFFDTNELMDRLEDHLVRIEADTELLRPQGEIIIGGSSDGNATSQLQHFFVREQTRRVTRMLDRADDRLARKATSLGGARNVRLTGRASSRRGVSAVPGRSKRQLAKLDPVLFSIDNNLFGQNLYRLLQNCALQSRLYGEDIADYLQDLVREAALLDALAIVSGPPAKTWLTIASLDEQGRAACKRLRDLYRTLFEREFGCVTAPPDVRIKEEVKSHGHFEVLSLDGPLASVLAPLEAGTHLFVSPDESYTPIVVSSRTSTASSEHELEGLPPVLRIYSDSGVTLDIRSRLLARGSLGRAELRAFVLSALPPPRELTG
jgi:ATP-dependent Clp protease ATP-binding subunit ClpA